MIHIKRATKTILRLLGLGLALLLVALASAYKIPASFLQDHPIWPLYIILAAYTLLLGTALVRGLAPRRLAVLAVAVFIFPIISLWLVSPSH